jgi:DNA transformation protein and related proteins
MATRPDTVSFLLEQLSSVPDVTARKMFGEYAIYAAGKVVALVCDDQLFVKPSDSGKRWIGKVTEGEPYPGAKPCFLIEGDRWEDGDWLSELIRVTAQALPEPQAKSGTRRSARAVAAAKKTASKTKTAKTKTAKTKTAKTPSKKTPKSRVSGAHARSNAASSSGRRNREV